MTVSSWWWNVVTDCPSLWSTITFGCPSAFIALQRSKAAPIDIQIVSRSQNWNNHLGPSVSAVKAHRERCRSLAFDGSAAAFISVQPLLKRTLPSLRTLSISLHPQSAINCVPINSPLTSLTLTSTLTPQNVALPASLRSLVLQSISGPKAPTASTVLLMLRQCPHIRTLHLQNLNPTGAAEDDTPQSPSVVLPHLHLLVLTRIPDTFATTLLRAIQAPELVTCTLELDTTQQSELSNVLFPDDQDAAPWLPLRNLQKAETPVALYAMFQLCLHKIRAKLVSRLHRLDFIVRFRDPPSDLGPNLLLLRPYTSLCLDTHLRLHGRLEDLTHLSNIPNITTLLVTEPETAKLVVNYLQPSGAADAVLPCPRLRHLHFEAWWDQEAVKALEKSREPWRGKAPRLKVQWRALAE